MVWSTLVLVTPLFRHDCPRLEEDVWLLLLILSSARALGRPWRFFRWGSCVDRGEVQEAASRLTRFQAWTSCSYSWLDEAYGLSIGCCVHFVNFASLSRLEAVACAAGTRCGACRPSRFRPSTWITYKECRGFVEGIFRIIPFASKIHIFRMFVSKFSLNFASESANEAAHENAKAFHDKQQLNV
jgi:hypothetical protein